MPSLPPIDVIVVGAGLSGIGAGYHLQTRCPDRRYLILEGRATIGGTWDLFRYPGIRSDSDMHTLGYAFRPWTGGKAIADGPLILRYIEETARQHGIDRHIRFGHRVVRAAWSSAAARWTVEAETDGGPVVLTCRFLYLCSGYYDYARGHLPDFAGAADFRGTIVHPQFWPETLDCTGKQIVVIGSGATAVTLVPALAATAAHVTMLQRSPSYIVSRPAADPVADRLARWLPASLAYRLTRWRNVLLGGVFYKLARRRPGWMAKRLIASVRRELGEAFDVARHFTPRYDPWDQRLCLVPDGDLLAAIREGRASVVTDTIDHFTPDGIRLASGEELRADVIVAATGLELKLAGGIALSIDGTPADLAQRFSYKGMMFSDVPNLASAFGYTNASWTLKADLTASYVCRLLNAMRRRRMQQVTPRPGKRAITARPFLDFTSGYVARGAHVLPRQGNRAPWTLPQDYLRDAMAMRLGSIDGEMEFSCPAPARDAWPSQPPAA